MKLILASQSPRRRQLLTDANYQFEIILPDDGVEDAQHTRETPQEYVTRLGKQKAQNVAQRLDQGLIIGCDTVAHDDGRVIGKPRDRDHAREILSSLRGKPHDVLSGLCLWPRPSDDFRVFIDTTRLFMREITDLELEDYLDSGLWEGKAGAFGYQDRTGWLEIVEGSETNVVGMPMELLTKALQEMMSGS